MAARDMDKTAIKADAVLPKEYSLRFDEMQELLRRARQIDREDTLQAINTAFLYGFALGNRATVAGRISKV